MWIFGITGNILSILVFTRKNLRKNSLSFYFVIIILNDTVQLIFGPMRRLLLAIDLNLDPLIHSLFLCKTWTFLIYFLNGFSAWILAIASLDRIKIILVSNYGFTQQRFFQVFIIIVVAFCLLVLNLPIIINIKLYEKEEEIYETNRTVLYYVCYNEEDKFKIVTSLIDLMVSSIIPFLIMITASIISLVILCRIKNKLKFKILKRKVSKRIIKKNDYQFAVTLVIFNALFLCFNLPICIALILANMRLIPATEFNFYIINILNLLMFLNGALSFPLCFLSNKIFQNEFIKLVCEVRIRISKKKLNNVRFNNDRIMFR